jgi:Lon-like ATP-dependent protease
MQNIKEGIEGHPVSWYSDVFDIVFTDLDREAANNIWKAQLTKPANEEKDRKQDDEN